MKSVPCTPSARSEWRSRISRVGGHRGQGRGHIGHRPSDRAGGVAFIADRNDPVAAHQPQRGPHADDRCPRRGRHDRASGLRADGDRRQIHGDRYRRPRRRAEWIDPRSVGAHHLAAQRAEPARRDVRHPVRPFGEVGLAQDDSARLAQPGDEMGVAVAAGAAQRGGAGGGVQPISGADVVLEQDRDAVQRPPSRGRLRARNPSGRQSSSASGFSSMTDRN